MPKKAQLATPVAPFARATESFEEALKVLEGDELAHATISEVEDRVEAMSKELLRSMMQGHVDLRSARELAATAKRKKR